MQEAGAYLHKTVVSISKESHIENKLYNAILAFFLTLDGLKNVKSCEVNVKDYRVIPTPQSV